MPSSYPGVLGMKFTENRHAQRWREPIELHETERIRPPESNEEMLQFISVIATVSWPGWSQEWAVIVSGFFFPFEIRNKRSFAKRRAVAEAETASHHSAHWQLPASVFLRNQDVFSCGCQGLVTKQQAVSSIAEIHRGRILTAWWSLTNSWPPNQFIRWLVRVWIRGLLTDT